MTSIFKPSTQHGRTNRTGRWERHFPRNTPDAKLSDSADRTRDQRKGQKISSTSGMRMSRCGLWLMRSGMGSSLWTHLSTLQYLSDVFVWCNRHTNVFVASAASQRSFTFPSVKSESLGHQQCSLAKPSRSRHRWTSPLPLSAHKRNRWLCVTVRCQWRGPRAEFSKALASTRRSRQIRLTFSLRWQQPY